MSMRTLSVAVAVRAMMGIRCSLRAAAMLSSVARMLRYSGRKSWPHSEIQWASSMAINEILNDWKNGRLSGLLSDSGAT